MKYFSIAELTRTNHAIDNLPSPAQEDNLKLLVEKVLDPAREEFGQPIKVTSGFRSEELNKKIGGAKGSQHMFGEAADIQCSDNKKLFRILADMEFAQLIYEFGTDEQPAWIHVSYSRKKNRNQILRAKKSKGKTVFVLKSMVRERFNTSSNFSLLIFTSLIISFCAAFIHY